MTSIVWRCTCQHVRWNLDIQIEWLECWQWVCNVQRSCMELLSNARLSLDIWMQWNELSPHTARHIAEFSSTFMNSSKLEILLLRCIFFFSSSLMPDHRSSRLLWIYVIVYLEVYKLITMISQVISRYKGFTSKQYPVGTEISHWGMLESGTRRTAWFFNNIVGWPVIINKIVLILWHLQKFVRS